MNIIKEILFNPFSKRFLDIISNLQGANKRIACAFLDFVYIVSIYFPLLAILILWDIMQPNIIIDVLFDILLVIVTASFLNKDFYNGQSVPKRLIGIQVIKVSDNKEASQLSCMIRNITFLIWPIEAIFILTNSKRRLGDYIAGTKIEMVEPSNPELIINDISGKKLVFISLVTCLLSLFIAAIALKLATLIN